MFVCVCSRVCFLGSNVWAFLVFVLGFLSGCPGFSGSCRVFLGDWRNGSPVTKMWGFIFEEATSEGQTPKAMKAHFPVLFRS